MLEADLADVELRDGAAWVKGTDRKVPLAAIATATNPLRYAFNEAAKAATQFAPASRHDGPPLDEGQHPGLEATDYYSPACATWAYGVHGAIVEVDPELCSVKVRKYVCLHDCGNMINPTIVEGQVMGGIAQGFGGALFERIEYDREGNPTNANFVDFLVPYATEIPQGRDRPSRDPLAAQSARRQGRRRGRLHRGRRRHRLGDRGCIEAARRRQVPSHADHAEHDPRGARAGLRRQAMRRQRRDSCISFTCIELI